jgi:hypothetical protein
MLFLKSQVFVFPFGGEVLLDSILFKATINLENALSTSSHIIYLRNQVYISEHFKARISTTILRHGKVSRIKLKMSYYPLEPFSTHRFCLCKA